MAYIVDHGWKHGCDAQWFTSLAKVSIKISHLRKQGFVTNLTLRYLLKSLISVLLSQTEKTSMIKLINCPALVHIHRQYYTIPC